MSDEELANQTNILKQKLEDGKELDDILSSINQSISTINK